MKLSFEFIIITGHYYSLSEDLRHQTPCRPRLVFSFESNFMNLTHSTKELQTSWISLDTLAMTLLRTWLGFFEHNDFSSVPKNDGNLEKPLLEGGYIQVVNIHQILLIHGSTLLIWKLLCLRTTTNQPNVSHLSSMALKEEMFCGFNLITKAAKWVLFDVAAKQILFSC